MYILAIGWMLAGASAVPPLRNGNGEVQILPRPAIILFWAAWCAPCRAEVSQIEALSRAAGPLPVIVVATDADRTSRRLLGGLAPDRVRYPDAPASDVLAMMPGGGGALPAAMAIDASGVVCASVQGPVNPAMLRQWRDRCLPADRNR